MSYVHRMHSEKLQQNEQIPLWSLNFKYESSACHNVKTISQNELISYVLVQFFLN